MNSRCSNKGESAAVAVHDIAVFDEARKREIPLRLTFPEGVERFPLIIWSPGYGFNETHYGGLMSYWACHGYGCMTVDHEDIRSSKDLPTEVNRKTRLGDLLWIIDSIQKIIGRVGGLSDRADVSSVGIGGHSLGAHTIQLIGGATMFDEVSGARLSCSRSEPRAFFMLAPQGTGLYFDEDSWKDFHRPAMVCAGTQDVWRNGSRDYTWRTEPFYRMPVGDKYLVIIKDAFHGYGGISGVARWRAGGPINERHQSIVRSVSLLFWDAYLKGDHTAMESLISANLADDCQGEVEIVGK
ncbi:MAG: hypothetical protein JW884_00400 [Deltaproteobacteria bacterium]|nr:hypothetical protein [Deltaproteobacteria bacterium]